MRVRFDLIWINGENFKTLKQAGMLYGPWTLNVAQQPVSQIGSRAVSCWTSANRWSIPNRPWAAGAFQWIYDTARMDADDLPRSYAELDGVDRSQSGPLHLRGAGTGRVPGHKRIVKQLMYELCGGPEPFTRI